MLRHTPAQLSLEEELMFRSIVALAILLAPVTVHPAADSKTPTAVPEGNVQAVSPAAPAGSLARILEKHSDVRLTANGVAVMRAPSRHVVLMRINNDGSKQTACADSLEAARTFMARSRAITAKQDE
jgi:hypothetical protein